MVPLPFRSSVRAMAIIILRVGSASRAAFIISSLLSLLRGFRANSVSGVSSLYGLLLILIFRAPATSIVTVRWYANDCVGLVAAFASAVPVREASVISTFYQVCYYG